MDGAGSSSRAADKLERARSQTRAKAKIEKIEAVPDPRVLLKDSVAEGNVLGIAKALYALALIPCDADELKNAPCGQQHGTQTQQAVPAGQAPRDKKLATAAAKALADWRGALSVGMEVDMLCNSDGKWYLAKIIDAGTPGVASAAEKKQAGGREGAGLAATRSKCSCPNFKLHYQGWKDMWDEWRCAQSPTLLPPTTHTKPKKKAERKQKRQAYTTVTVVEAPDGTILGRIGEDGILQPAKDALADAAADGGGGSGRRRRHKRPAPQLAPLRKQWTKKPAAGFDVRDGNGGCLAAAGDDDDIGDVASPEEVAARAKARAAALAEMAAAERGQDLNAWICSACLLLDSPDSSGGSTLLSCGGPCGRSFHKDCVDELTPAAAVAAVAGAAAAPAGAAAVPPEAAAAATPAAVTPVAAAAAAAAPATAAAAAVAKWFCPDCTRGEHACWECGLRGEDRDDSPSGVWQCAVEGCGYFYHMSCIASCPTATDLSASSDSVLGEGAGGSSSGGCDGSAGGGSGAAVDAAGGAASGGGGAAPEGSCMTVASVLNGAGKNDSNGNGIASEHMQNGGGGSSGSSGSQPNGHAAAYNGMAATAQLENGVCNGHNTAHPPENGGRDGGVGGRGGSKEFVAAAKASKLCSGSTSAARIDQRKFPEGSENGGCNGAAAPHANGLHNGKGTDLACKRSDAGVSGHSEGGKMDTVVVLGAGAGDQLFLGAGATNQELAVAKLPADDGERSASAAGNGSVVSEEPSSERSAECSAEGSPFSKPSAECSAERSGEPAEAGATEAPAEGSAAGAAALPPAGALASGSGAGGSSGGVTTNGEASSGSSSATANGRARSGTGTAAAAAAAAATSAAGKGGAGGARQKFRLKDSAPADIAAGKPVFRCGRHACMTCAVAINDHRIRKAPINEKLYSCSKCPTAFHTSCVPPGAEKHAYAFQCPDHPETPLPPLREIEADAIKNASSLPAYEWVKPPCGLPEIRLPKSAPLASRRDDPRHFRLPTRLFEKNSRPPMFQTIKSLLWIAPRPPRREATPMCTCVTACDENCMNRLVNVECVGVEPAAASNGGGGSSTKWGDAKFDNCSLGSKCGNRRLQRREVARTQRFREEGRGWGLRAAEDIPRGTLVAEYVGEVIDCDEMDRRLAKHQELHPDDHNFYIMELSNDLYVDARHKGNDSRLINHSCDPNCALSCWDAGGTTRIGIFAHKDIADGEALSYDYQFSTADASKFRCFCGAASCRGTMAPKAADNKRGSGGGGGSSGDGGSSGGGGDGSDGSGLRGEARAKALKAAERNAVKIEADNVKRLDLTARTLPGDPSQEVQAGPPTKYWRAARYGQVFLPRNARKGFDMLMRLRLLKHSIAAAKRGIRMGKGTKRTAAAAFGGASAAAAASSSRDGSSSRGRSASRGSSSNNSGNSRGGGSGGGGSGGCSSGGRRGRGGSGGSSNGQGKKRGAAAAFEEENEEEEEEELEEESESEGSESSASFEIEDEEEEFKQPAAKQARGSPGGSRGGRSPDKKNRGGSSARGSGSARGSSGGRKKASAVVTRARSPGGRGGSSPRPVAVAAAPGKRLRRPVVR